MNQPKSFNYYLALLNLKFKRASFCNVFDVLICFETPEKNHQNIIVSYNSVQNQIPEQKENDSLPGMEYYSSLP